MDQTHPPTQTTKYAGFWIRFVASIVDAILLQITTYLLQLMVMGAGFWIGQLAGVNSGWLAFDASLSSIQLQLINALLYVLVSTPYYVIGHAKYRTTIGKRLFSIYVLDEKSFGTMSWKQSWGRYAASGLSYLPLCGGYLMVAFHPEKRALHDLMAGTVSVTYSSKPTETSPVTTS